MTIGRNLKDTIFLEYRANRVRFRLADPLFPTSSFWTPIRNVRRHEVSLVADSSLQRLTIALDGQPVLTSPLSTDETVSQAITTRSAPGRTAPVVVTQVPVAVPALCRPLVSAR